MSRIQRATALLLAFVAPIAVAGDAPPSAATDSAPAPATLRLRGEAQATGGIIRVQDVLVVPDPAPDWLAAVLSQAIAAPQEAGPVELTHAQVVEGLASLGIGAAQVLVNGALRCRVQVSRAAEVEGGGEGDAEAAGAAEWVGEPAGEADGGATLASQIVSQVRRELADLGGQVEVEFDRASQEFLDVTAPPFEFAIRPHRGAKLGLRQFSVTLRRDGRVMRSVQIGARVKLLQKVLVAARPLNQGSLLKRDALEFAARIFTDERDLGVTQPERVIGQQVRNFVPAGEMLRVQDLKSIDLVSRSRPVTVSGGRGIRIQWVGTALDNGELGEVVRVRLGDVRSRRVVRGVVSGVATVQLLEDE